MPKQFKLVPQIARVGKEYILELSPENDARAVDLHQRLIVFDLHLHGVVFPEDVEDTSLWMKTFRYELGYERIKHAGLTAYIDGVASMGHSWSMDEAIREIGLRGCDMEHNSDKIIRATHAEDVRRPKREGKTAIFMTIENAEPKILDLLLKKEMKLAGERGLTLELTEPAKTWLLAQNDHPEWGARPLRRIIQKFMREPLADYLLEKNPVAGTKIKVDVEGKGLKIADH